MDWNYHLNYLLMLVFAIVEYDSNVEIESDVGTVVDQLMGSDQDFDWIHSDAY